MRIWHPIPPLCLDRQRLLGEHRELHAIWAILTEDRSGYRSHPETLRWEGHLTALRARHEQLVEEMESRGYRHRSPLYGDGDGHCADILTDGTDLVWPETWEPVEAMRVKLAEKQTLQNAREEVIDERP